MKNQEQVSPNRTPLVNALLELDEESALELVHARIAERKDALQIIEECQEGMRLVGLRYEEQRYYLSGLIMAGEIFRQVVELVQPILEADLSGSTHASVLLGTVRGDIHDIGKNLIAILLRCYGFSVIDLGVDVEPAHFLEKAEEIKPDAIGLSGLITTSYDSMRLTVEQIRSSSDSTTAALPIIIGGGLINEQISELVGADFWTAEAMAGIRICQKLFSGFG
jgi:methanogenic corrinoid protein MtbC1